MCIQVDRSHVLALGPDGRIRNPSPFRVASSAFDLGYEFFILNNRLFRTPETPPTVDTWHSEYFHRWKYSPDIT
jgi:hypothetical protein